MNSNRNVPPSFRLEKRSSPEFHEACQVLSNNFDIPGPFVILQGIPGDGMANTIDSMPELNLDGSAGNNNDDFVEPSVVQNNNSRNDEGVPPSNQEGNGGDGGASRAISSDLSLSNCSTSGSSNSSRGSNNSDNDGRGGAEAEAEHILECTSETSSVEMIHHPLEHGQMQVDESHISSAPLPLDVNIDTHGDGGGANNESHPRTQALMTNHGLNLPIPQVTSMGGCNYNSIIPPIGVPYPQPQTNNTSASAAAVARNVNNNQIDDSFIIVDGKKSKVADINDIEVKGSESKITDTNSNDLIRDIPDEPSSSYPSLSSSSEEARDMGTTTSTPSNPRYTNISPSNMRSLNQWTESSRQQELKLRQEMLQQSSHRSNTRDPPSVVTTANSSSDDPSLTENMWWRGKKGYLSVFDVLPIGNDHSIVHENLESRIVGELAPGTTVMGTEMVCIGTSKHSDRMGLTPPPINRARSDDRRRGMVQILKIESPIVGFVVYSIDGYTLIGPGLPSCYIEPDLFLWKVTCPNGAYVRQGLELTSVHVDTIPFGSLVRVVRKTINAMGLARLQIEALVGTEGQQQQQQNSESSSHTATRGTTRARNLASSLLRLGSSKSSSSNPDRSSKLSSATKQEETTKIVSGWISEKLNPLSGQSGPVVQPVPFPVPALFRVILPEGAVIRKGVELSSQQIGHAPMGTVLNIVGRGYTQHPMDRCIQRLKLAGGGGWVSVRLNRSPPRDQPIVLEQIGIDGTFDPDEAGLFHIEKQLLVMHEFNMNIRSPNESDRQSMENVRRSLQRLGSWVSSINDDDENLGDSVELSNNDDSLAPSHVPTLYRSGVANEGDSSNQQRLKGYGSKVQKDDPCLICLTEERNSTIVHGETGHIACCLACARILKARGDKCPVCRLPIDSIIQQFWA